ncbi:LysR family transcriptional regulator [Sneathiella sp. P13V-1]|uniref:LysR family transcriptional regulator n=1 Tax=Sneathiella sp. P13V-1 TaxID=2697366 RepID=UPI00187B918D|nr:LysR family transcriptional regulator [Sneathiella sp. P13V-1]MBE7638552.1 LysR family transcriptional regulator [Sneathiella sp. P13V-1]
MFDWNDIRFFLELSRKGRLTEVSKALKVDHTTVSRRIATLEKELDAKLFESTARGYVLTQAGEKLLPQAEAMESASATIQDDVGGENRNLTGVVRLGVPEGFGSQFLSKDMPLFRTIHPGIELEFVANDRFVSLSKREADLSITLARPRSGRLVSKKLTDYTLRLYASRDYLDNHAKIKNIDDLKDHNFVSYIEELVPAPEMLYLTELINNPNVTLKSSSIVFQFQAVLSGAGLGIMHCFVADEYPELVPLLEEDIEVKRTFWLNTPEDIHDLARIKAVTQFLTERVEARRKSLLGIS